MRILIFVFISSMTLFAPSSIIAQEEGIGIDFNALFIHHEEQIIEFGWGGFQVLSLAGGVRVGRRGQPGNYVYHTSDLSEGGAVGCLLSIMISLNTFDKICPEVATEQKKARMQTGLQRVVAFYAENTYPPASLDAIEEAVNSLANETAQRYEIPSSLCEDYLKNTSMYFFLREGFERKLETALAVSRLPVNSPCLLETSKYAWETGELERQ